MFKCTQCGECCRNLNKSSLYDALNRGDGTCIYLVNNKCSIYNKRPLLCRVDESYKTYFKKQYSLKEYYEMNYKACKTLKENK